ncbi:MAG TPA: PepSY-like domain-containing protein [Opitutaceae bacterium]
MNPRLSALTLASAFVVALPSYAADENAEFNRLPAAVKETVRAAHIDGPVKDVTVLNIQGETIYVVEFEQSGAVNPRLRISADGSLVGAPDASQTPPQRRAGTGAPVVGPAIGIPVGNSALELQSLPEPVQETVRKEAGDRQIASVDEEERDGQKVYEVEFAEPGLNPQIHVSADGTLLIEKDPGDRLRAWLPGLRLEDTPVPVQQAVREEVGERRVVDVDRKDREGDEVYEIEVRDDDGRFSLEVTRNGDLLRDSRRDREGTPAE